MDRMDGANAWMGWVDGFHGSDEDDGVGGCECSVHRRGVRVEGKAKRRSRESGPPAGETSGRRMMRLREPRDLGGACARCCCQPARLRLAGGAVAGWLAISLLCVSCRCCSLHAVSLPRFPARAHPLSPPSVPLASPRRPATPGLTAPAACGRRSCCARRHFAQCLLHSCPPTSKPRALSPPLRFHRPGPPRVIGPFLIVPMSQRFG